MRNFIVLFFLTSVILLSCKKTSKSDDSISVQKVDYSGCFAAQSKSLKSTSYDLTDSLYYVINNSTLTLYIDKVYPCCGLIKDSVIIKNNVMSIYLNDKHKNSYACNCICLFKINYSITGYQQKNIDFKVYIKNIDNDNFSLWKKTKFINRLD